MNHLLRHIFIICLMACIQPAVAQLQAPGILWQKCIGGSFADAANSIVCAKDGGYVIAGSSRSNDGDFVDNRSKEDYAIVKTDSLGKVIWARNYGGDRADIATSVKVATQGGYIVAGYAHSIGGDVLDNNGTSTEASDYWLVKLDENGYLEWQSNFGGSNYEYAYAVDNSPDGGYIVVGLSSSNDGDVVGDHGNGDCWLVKLDRNGALQWQRSMGGNNPDVGRSVKATPDGGYIVAGFSFSYNGDVKRDNRAGNMWIVKLAADGKEEWQKSVGGSLTDYAYDIAPVSDGGYIVTGSVNSNDEDISGNHGKSDCVVFKLSNKGDLQWLHCFGGTEDDAGQSVKETADGSFVIAGYTKSNNGNILGAHGDVDAWIIRLTKQGVFEWQKTVGGAKADQLNAVIANGDGSLVLAGMTQSNDADVTGNHSSEADMWLIKLTCIPVMPAIKIEVSKNPVCSGYATSFTATTHYAGNKPKFQWMKNGIPVGNDDPVYTTNNIQESDEICCVLESNGPCAQRSQVKSDTIIMKTIVADPNTQPSVSILASDSSICQGGVVHFTAKAVRGGSVPGFSWKINDIIQQDTGQVFTTSNLQQQDEVRVYMYVENACADSVSSNAIRINVLPAAVVTCMNDTTVPTGTSLPLKATIAGNVSSYAWYKDAVLISSMQQPTVVVGKTSNYQLQVTNTAGCVSVDEVRIFVIDQLKIPNAFTPNGDGVNDTWIIRGLDPQANYRIKIFDRYGKLVADLKAGGPPWDGSIRNKPLPAAVYYYIISSQTAPSYSGAITILR